MSQRLGIFALQPLTALSTLAWQPCCETYFPYCVPSGRPLQPRTRQRMGASSLYHPGLAIAIRSLSHGQLFRQADIRCLL
jgi:hypothetical protein